MALAASHAASHRLVLKPLALFKPASTNWPVHLSHYKALTTRISPCSHNHSPCAYQQRTTRRLAAKKSGASEVPSQQQTASEATQLSDTISPEQSTAGKVPAAQQEQAAGPTAKAKGQVHQAAQAADDDKELEQEDKDEMDGGADEGEEEEGEEGEELEELSHAEHIITVDSFHPRARELRAVFDERFEDPRKIHAQRFMWDYWHIPDQYTLIRTQAQVYFPQDLYEALVDRLLEYGESQLGCRGITPIWMSYYVDGCSQELHCDNPHGPFAFVFSLTEWEQREFKGGETMILQPHVLNYFHTYDARKGQEHRDLFTLVEPLFNRLTVFDPRFPHGVKPVTGTKDPRKARLVLHGWFTEPSPFFTGDLTSEAAEPVLNAALEEVFEALADEHPATGTLTLRIDVSGEDGCVKAVSFLADTLVPLASVGIDSQQVRARIQHVIHDVLLEMEFPTKELGGEDSSVTLPIVFE